jgi:ribosomal-protein-alanine N-acetyltransferase
MAKAIIRPMEERDVERVHDLEVAGFATPWSVQSFRDELRNVCARYVVLEDESGIQAYGGIWMIIGEAQVTTLTTDPGMRGRGYGEAVLRALMQTAYDTLGIQEMTLEVRVGNEPAKHLYHKLGFVDEGIRPHYYEDNGEDAIIMWNHDIRPFLDPSSLEE